MRLLPVLLFASWSVAAEPAGYFADHMVLQREQPIVIWGTAAPNETVRVTLADQTGSCEAGASGQWKPELSAMDAGGPYELTISDASGDVGFKDVMIARCGSAAGSRT